MLISARRAWRPLALAAWRARLLMAERRRRRTPKGSRALTCFWQAVLGLRWFRDRTAPDALARDHGISRATTYRYLEEVIAVLADEAPDLRQALEWAKGEGYPHVILDGTIIPLTGAGRRPSASTVRSSTCGTPARLMPTAATSRRCFPGRVPAVGYEMGRQPSEDPAGGVSGKHRGRSSRCDL
jgi:hypothetical protein